MRGDWSDRFFLAHPPLIAALAICALAAAAHRLIAGSASANLLLPGNLQAARGAIVFDPAEAGLTLVQAQGLDPRIAMDMDGPLWSLGYEFWFYVLAGLTALAILRRGVTPAVGIVALMAAPLVADNARFYGFLIIWCLGAVWFVALTSGIDAARLARWALIAAAGFVLAATAALVVGGPRVANPHYTGAEFVFQTAVVGLGSIALAAYLRRSTARAPRTVRAVASTAAYSYTLYVVHFPLLLVLFAFANPFLAPRSILYSILFLDHRRADHPPRLAPDRARRRGQETLAEAGRTRADPTPHTCGGEAPAPPSRVAAAGYGTTRVRPSPNCRSPSWRSYFPTDPSPSSRRPR